MVKLRCRLCKKIQNHGIIIEFADRLPAHLACVQCLGCGVMGIEMIREPETDDEL